MIRPIREDDVPGARRLLYAVSPELPVGSERAIRHWLESQPERARFRCLVAEEHEEVVGWAHEFLHWQTSVEGAAKAWVAVGEPWSFTTRTGTPLCSTTATRRGAEST